MKRLLCILFIFIQTLCLFAADIAGVWRNAHTGSEGSDRLVIHENGEFFLFLNKNEAGETELIKGKIGPLDYGWYSSEIFSGPANQKEIYFSLERNGFIDLSFYRDGDYVFLRTFERDENSPEISVSSGSPEQEILPPPRKKPNPGKITFDMPDIFFTFGNIGLDSYFSDTNRNDLRIVIDIYSFVIRDYITGIGFEIIPASYSYGFFQKEHCFSFLKARLFWNLFDFPLERNQDFDSYDKVLGPVVSLDWLNIYNFKAVDFDDIMVSAGVRFALTYNNRFTVLKAEAGYRYQAGRNSFYLSVSSENLPLFLTLWPLFTW